MKEPIMSIFGVWFCGSCHGTLWQNINEANYCFRCGCEIDKSNIEKIIEKSNKVAKIFTNE